MHGRVAPTRYAAGMDDPAQAAGSAEAPFLPAPAEPGWETHDDPEAALAAVQRLYQQAVERLRAALRAYLEGRDPPGRVRACYPAVRVQVQSALNEAEARFSHGFLAGPGVYETSLTRPELFGPYLRRQFELLLRHHGELRRSGLQIGPGREPMPIHFALPEQAHLEGTLDPLRRACLRDVFDLPDLAAMDDGIANGSHEPAPGAPRPLALFTAPRIDYSLHRLRHYTGTLPEHFQNFVLFTNYAFYVDEFVRLGRALMDSPVGEAEAELTERLGLAPSQADDFVAFVEPGNVLHRRRGLTLQPADFLGQTPPRLPQMPAFHLMRSDRSGITLVNIGVGPSNAKTITDHVAVLRPHAWLMLGHCAGLRTTQQLGDYVLAHGYVREDHVLDEDLPLWVPIPPLAEVQQALEGAVAEVTRMQGSALKQLMRTGTVASTDNRNWELLPHPGPERRFSQSRAIALDMESATIAANGFRFRVPYGTLLCVSDKPLHGELKLPGMADVFYRQRVQQHLQIGLRAVERLRAAGSASLHSRKLRSFDEVAFQ